MNLLYFIYLVAARPAAADRPPFRLQLFAEPTTLDPVLNRGAGGNYLYHAIYRGLFAYRGDDGLIPAGARGCRRENKRLRCTLNPESRWSDGRPIVAAQYVNAFRRVADPRVASPHADLVDTLVHARDVRAGTRPPAELGVHATDDRTLVFDLAEDDFEFEYRLIHPALSPRPDAGYPALDDAAKLVTSGPYRIAEWTRGGRGHLEANAHRAHAGDRPPVEVVAVDDDSTALSLFETGKLSFLRRLVASEIPRFKGRPGFFQVPQARFDYVGFGPDLTDRPRLRDALTTSVDYPQFLKLFDTRTPPGCISLPARYLMSPRCIAFQPTGLAAKRALVADWRADFFFSKLGGEDIHRAVEWFAAQWKKNLGATLSLRSEEQGVYVARLRARPPALFRKGVGLDRPTCLAALELFAPGHPENYLRLDDASFNHSLERLRRARTARERRDRCGVAVNRLLATRRLIPLGEMYFTLLVDPRFSGWDLSEVNHLDLSRLVYHEKVGATSSPTGPPKARSGLRRRYGHHPRRTSMSEKKNVENPAAACCAEKCGKKADRLNFCPEHYAWFKEGLLNKQGVRPSDFDKKFQAYSLRHKKTA